MTSSKFAETLTSGRLLARNVLWNLLGQTLPLLVGLAAIPPLVRGIGVPRFGVVSLAATMIGYASVFELGLGRALTKLVAAKLSTNDERGIPPLIWTSLLLMALLGLVGGAIMASIAPVLVYNFLTIPGSLQTETLHSFYLLASAIPIITVTSGLRGVLEALQRFRLLNSIRVTIGVLILAGPLAMLPFSHALEPVIAVLVVVRSLSALVHVYACFHAMPALRHGFALDRTLLLPALRFGGWLTVSNIIAPIMAYMDRFLLGAIISVEAVAYYTAPFDMVTRVLVVPVAIASVLFPAFTMSFAREPSRLALLVSRGAKSIFLATFPAMMIIIILAPEFLHLWLGAEFATQSSAVLQWLAVGVFINSLAQIPSTLLQSAGRPDITAKLHLLEAPLYLISLYLMAKARGIEGAAIVWTGRIIADGALLLICAHRHVALGQNTMLRIALSAGLALMVFYLASWVPGLLLKSLSLALFALLFSIVAWAFILTAAERALLRDWRRAMSGSS